MTLNITEYRGALTLTLALPQSERLPNSTRSLERQEPIRENQEPFPLAWRCALPYLAANADGGGPAEPETRRTPRTDSPDRLEASRRGSDGPALGPGHRIGAPAMVRNRIPGPRKRGSSSREAATGHFGGH